MGKMLIAALKAWKDLLINILSYLIIISLFKNQFLVILSIFSEMYMYWTIMFKKLKKYILQKRCIFALECVYFLPFNFVIWQAACECIYSLKHISLTYFRYIP